MKRLLFAVAICSCMIQAFNSCRDAGLETERLNTHRTGVQYVFNLSNVADGNKPDTMFVLANRIIGLWKSSMKVSTSDGKGIYLYNPQNMLWGNPDSVATAADILSRFYLQSGDFKFLAFTYDADQLDYSGVDSFMVNDEATTSELYVKYNLYNLKELDSLLENDTTPTRGGLRERYLSWTDRNLYKDSKNTYLLPEATPICRDVLNMQSLNDGNNKTLRFTPKRVTQKIDFSFEIGKTFDEKDDKTKFVITAAIAEISGVPVRLDLMTGYIDISETGKMMFHVDFDEDSFSNKTVKCTASVDVPTIVPSSSDITMRGPGILQLVVFYMDKNGKEHKKQHKINLYNMITTSSGSKRIPLLYSFTNDGLHALKKGDNPKINFTVPNIDIKTEDTSGWLEDKQPTPIHI
jgi:hypothetical protein